MQNLQVEQLVVHGALSSELAHNIYRHGPQTKIAIVANDPLALLSSTRKQWLKLIRRVRRERSSTLNAKKILELSQQLAWMERLRFTAKPPQDTLEADVTFATAEDFVRVPPVCRIVYIAYKFEREKLYMLTSWMPKGGLVVICCE